MKLEPNIEMHLDYLANQVNRLDDINIHSRKKNREAVLNIRKERMSLILKETVKKFRDFRMKLLLLERENMNLRGQIKANINEKVLEENKKLKAQLEEIRAILGDDMAQKRPHDKRLSA